MTIAELGHNKGKAIVEKITGDSLISSRILEIGLHEGMCIELVGRAPFGGAIILRAGNMIVALREEEARCAQVRLLP